MKTRTLHSRRLTVGAGGLRHRSATHTPTIEDDPPAQHTATSCRFPHRQQQNNQKIKKNISELSLETAFKLFGEKDENYLEISLFVKFIVYFSFRNLQKNIDNRYVTYQNFVNTKK